MPIVSGNNYRERGFNRNVMGAALAHQEHDDARRYVTGLRICKCIKTRSILADMRDEFKQLAVWQSPTV